MPIPYAGNAHGRRRVEARVGWVKTRYSVIMALA
jgi:hypothetical protein